MFNEILELLGHFWDSTVIVFSPRYIGQINKNRQTYLCESVK